MREVKIFSAFLLIALLCVGLFLAFYNEKPLKEKKMSAVNDSDSARLIKTHGSSKESINESLNNKTLIEQLKVACPELKGLKQNELEKARKETLARNFHFKRDGEIFRLRLFLEDGKEGTFEKLILLKENAEGFPVIQKISEKDQINPSKEVWEKYLKDGEIIYREIDQRLSMGEREVTFTRVNGKLVKAVSSAGDCFFEKR